jgi:PUA-domain protein
MLLIVPNASHRHFLKEREARRILSDSSRRLRINVEELFGPSATIETAESSTGGIFIVNGQPLLAKFNDDLFPTLFFNRLFPHLPKVIVDMGAVPHVCNGADVMAPGVVCIEGEFDEGEIVLIVDERHRKPLAIGVARLDSQVAGHLRRGKLVKTIHYVGDQLWIALNKM